jgi:molybdopterin-synthase adenylyltransferase
MPYETGPDGRPNPGYRDLFPEAAAGGPAAGLCRSGILGALTGVMGSLQALEAIKLITGVGEPLVGRLLLFDGLSMRFETMRYAASGETEIRCATSRL